MKKTNLFISILAGSVLLSGLLFTNGSERIKKEVAASNLVSDFYSNIDNNRYSDPVDESNVISLSRTTLGIEKDQTSSISVSSSNTSDEISAIIGDISVAEITSSSTVTGSGSFTIKGLKTGSTTLTVSQGDNTAQCTIIIADFVDIITTTSLGFSDNGAFTDVSLKSTALYSGKLAKSTSTRFYSNITDNYIKAYSVNRNLVGVYAKTYKNSSGNMRSLYYGFSSEKDFKDFDYENRTKGILKFTNENCGPNTESLYLPNEQTNFFGCVSEKQSGSGTRIEYEIFEVYWNISDIDSISIEGNLSSKVFKGDNITDYTGITITAKYKNGLTNVLSHNTKDLTITNTAKTSLNDEYEVIASYIDPATNTEVRASKTYSFSEDCKVETATYKFNNNEFTCESGPTYSTFTSDSNADSSISKFSAGQYAILKIDNLANVYIRSIRVEMKSNSSSGTGTLNVKKNDAYIFEMSENLGFNQWFNNTGYSNVFKLYEVPISSNTKDTELAASDIIEINLSCSVNALYLQKIEIDYVKTKNSTLTYVKSSSIGDLLDGCHVLIGGETNIENETTTTTTYISDSLSSNSLLVNSTGILDKIYLTLDTNYSRGEYVLSSKLISDNLYYSFKDVRSGQYLSGTNTTSLACAATDESNDAWWSINFQDGKYSIVNCTYTGRRLSFDKKPSETPSKIYCPVVSGFNETTYGCVSLYVDQQSVLEKFSSDYLHMNTYDPQHNSEGNESCKGENGYYAIAKTVLNGFSESIRLSFFTNASSDAYKRFEAWANANGDTIINNTIVAKSSTNIFGFNDNEAILNEETAPIVIAATSSTAILGLGYLFLKKKKQSTN